MNPGVQYLIAVAVAVGAILLGTVIGIMCGGITL